MAKKKAAGPRTVQCYHCGQRFEVSARAMTGSCPKCYGKLMYDDVVIKNTQSYKRLQTCGRLLIEPKGRVIADFVSASEGIEVKGKIEAKSYEGGPVIIRKKAFWQGDCRAPTLELEEGALVRSGYFIIPADPIGDAAAQAEQTPDRTTAMLEADTEIETKPVMKTSSTRRPRPTSTPTPVTRAAPEPTVEDEKPKIKTSSTRQPRPAQRVIPAEPSSVSAQKKKKTTKKTKKKAAAKKTTSKKTIRKKSTRKKS